MVVEQPIVLTLSFVSQAQAFLITVNTCLIMENYNDIIYYLHHVFSLRNNNRLVLGIPKLHLKTLSEYL